MRHSILFLLVFGALTTVQAQTFTNSNYLLPSDYHTGNVVGMSDMDNDGFDDVIVLNFSEDLIILYQEADGSFTEVEFGSISNSNQWGMCVADYDNDGHKDVFSGGSYDGVHVMNINSPSDYSLLELASGSMFMQACNFADIDNDGQVDAFGCHDDALSRMWRGSGEELVPAPEVIDLTDYALQDYPGNDHSGNYGTCWSDFDGDGDTDLIIAKCRQFINDPEDPRRINQIWVNDGNGNYTEDAAARGLVFNEQSWTVDFADIDNDGDFDCFLTNHSTNMQLLENDGAGYFTDISEGSGVDFTGFVLQALLADFDNDGYVDLVYGGGLDGYFHNNGDKTFTAVSILPNEETMHSFGLGDANRDGFVDVYAGYGTGYTNADASEDDILWMNDANENHWIAFDLQGIESNNDAIGATVTITGTFGTQIREVRAGESYGIVSTMHCMFGLGETDVVETALIHWPSGQETIVVNPGTDQYHSLVEAPCTAEVNVFADVVEICEGEVATISVEGEYLEYQWSTGETGVSSIELAGAGNVSVLVYDAEGCAGISNTVSVVMLGGETPEVTATGELVFCSGGSVELISSYADSWIWSSGETSQSIVVETSGTYSVATVDVCGLENSSAVVEIEVHPTPLVPVVTGAEITAGETADLNGDSENLRWYDEEFATTPVYVGSTFTTPVISETTTFWVEDAYHSPFSEGMGGESDQQDGQYHQNSVRWLVFDAHEDIELVSVKVFADEAGTREIGVSDASGDVLVMAQFDLPAGESIVDLNFEIPAGEGYGLRTFDENPGLWRDSAQKTSDLGYPYALGDLATITQSTAGGDNAFNYYYFFYDWTVQSPSTMCASDRIAVTVTVVGVGEWGAARGLDVFPNPARDAVQVAWAAQAGERVTATWVDATGRTVLSEAFIASSGAHVLKVSALPPGVYQLRLESADAIEVGQIVIQ